MRFTACSAIPSAERGGRSMEQEKPVGSTMRRSAPCASAAGSGVLLAKAPSESWRSAIRTGGKTAGIAALASTASTADPDERQASSPDSTSVATTWQGIFASSSRATGRLRSRSARSRSGASRCERRPMKPRKPPTRPIGNTSRRRRPRQMAPRLSIPARSGRPAK